MIKYTEYKYHLAALFSVAVWGATFVSTKVLIANSLTPAEIFLLRFAMAYVCILPFARGRMWAANLRDELLLAAAGLSGGSLYFLTENMALEYAPASNVSLIVCTAPVWTAVVMSLFYRGERMSRRQIAGSALAFDRTSRRKPKGKASRGEGGRLACLKEDALSTDRPPRTPWRSRRRCYGWFIRW